MREKIDTVSTKGGSIALNGLDPNIFKIASINRESYIAGVTAKEKEAQGAGKSEAIREYEFAKQDPNFLKFLAQRKQAMTINLGGLGTGVQYQPIDVSKIKNKNAGNPEWGGLTYNGLLNASKLYLAQGGKIPALGLGQAKDVRLARETIINYAGQLADSLGMDINEISALYHANSKAASTIIERVARIESTSGALAAQFPRLAELAKRVGTFGIQESDITAGKARVARKFGSVDAGNFVELIQTVRGDYTALQSSLAGSRGAQFFAQNAQDAVPLGLTPEQYLGLADTIVVSAQKAFEATRSEAQQLIGQIGQPSNIFQTNQPPPQATSKSNIKNYRDKYKY